MPSSLSSPRSIASAAAFTLLAAALSLSAVAAPPARLPVAHPPLAPGQSLVYRLQYRSQVQSNSAGPVYQPEAAHNLLISLTARIRLDVLAVTADSRVGRLTRFRATCESADARVESDAYDPGVAALQESYRDLQGQTFEFTLDSAGRIRDLPESQPPTSVRSADTALRQWLVDVTLPLGLWRSGVKPGRKWVREVPLLGAPLAGLAWRTQSTYRENQPCPPSPGAATSLAHRTCAVIVTRLQSVRHGGDPTPSSFRRHGLRVSGKWNATGESLSYVSLSFGLVTSDTATESDRIDFTIASDSGSSLHYSAQITTASQISLLAFTSPLPQPSAPH